MRRFAMFASAIVLSASLVLSAGTSLAEQPSYIGSAGCKMCHGAKTGDQWTKWLESPHAKAFEVLKGEAAAKTMADKGLSGNAWENAECLGCHTTAYKVDAALKGAKFTLEEGVGCEACHGPGSEYKAMKTMQSREASVAAGLIIPTAETCTGCHNEKSPTFKGFDFEKYAAKIAHPNPNKGK